MYLSLSLSSTQYDNSSLSRQMSSLQKEKSDLEESLANEQKKVKEQKEEIEKMRNAHLSAQLSYQKKNSTLEHEIEKLTVSIRFVHSHIFLSHALSFYSPTILASTI